MLLGQFPDNFDVSDACGWMTQDDYSDFQHQKRFEGGDNQQLFTADNNYNLNFAPEVNDQQPLHENQLGLGQGMSQNNSQVVIQNNQQLIAQTNIVNQQPPPLLQAPPVQPQKVQEIMLSSSQYSQQLHEMHLHHLEQISHTTNSSEYYNRPLEGPRSVLPIDSMNHETGESAITTVLTKMYHKQSWDVLSYLRTHTLLFFTLCSEVLTALWSVSRPKACVLLAVVTSLASITINSRNFHRRIPQRWKWQWWQFWRRFRLRRHGRWRGRWRGKEKEKRLTAKVRFTLAYYLSSWFETV